jgi:hypothetical protein
MVAKCANPDCHVGFRYLRGGKLFLLDIPRSARREAPKATASQRPLEYFWLCDQCSGTMQVVVTESGHVAISSRPDAGPNLPMRPAA